MRNLLRGLRFPFSGSRKDLGIRHMQGPNGNHVVEATIRVWLHEDAGMWVAQGLDVDYVAAGITEEDAKERFARGFTETIRAHLEEFGSIEHFNKPAPREVFSAYLAASRGWREQTRMLPQLRDVPQLPSALTFLEPCAA